MLNPQKFSVFLSITNKIQDDFIVISWAIGPSSTFGQVRFLVSRNLCLYFLI